MNKKKKNAATETVLDKTDNWNFYSKHQTYYPLTNICSQRMYGRLLNMLQKPEQRYTNWWKSEATIYRLILNTNLISNSCKPKKYIAQVTHSSLTLQEHNIMWKVKVHNCKTWVDVYRYTRSIKHEFIGNWSNPILTNI